jgi:protein-S-isoprenylcysteine O-methyltransferase Ste14
VRQQTTENRRNLTAWNHVRAVLLLPVMNTIIIPSALIAIFGGSRLVSAGVPENVLASVVAIPLLAFGFGLVIRSVSLFIRRGKGTLAPWDPTEVLLTEDVYRFTRNPMKAGLFIVLIGECILLRSAVLTVWAVSFIAANVVYISWIEEKGLSDRFGEDYSAYCQRVPRWLRLVPEQHAGVDFRGRTS